MNKSIEAYDNYTRVARYDADMDLMHPNRHKMVDVALEVVPFPASEPIRVLDLGVGTGYFAMRLLQAFPNASLVGLDGSGAMIELAETRLAEFAGEDRVSFVQARFQDVGSALAAEDGFDLVFSSYSLHHLDPSEKQKVIGWIIQHLNPAGWFINADLVSHASADIERAIQDARVAGIHQRNQDRGSEMDPRFTTPADIRRFLDDLEATEGDQPLYMEEDLEILRQCGIANATVFWKEYREIVSGGSIR